MNPGNFLLWLVYTFTKYVEIKIVGCHRITWVVQTNGVFFPCRDSSEASSGSVSYVIITREVQTVSSNTGLSGVVVQ